MKSKYSENMILKVCYAIAAVIIVAIAGIAVSVKNVLKSIA